MTRQEAKTWLVENFGLEEPTNAQVSAYLNSIRDAKNEAIVETTDKLMNDYKDYKSPSEVKKYEDEIATLKDSSAKSTRLAKYKEVGLIEDQDILDMVDGKLKGSNDFEKELAEYVKAHPSFFTKKAEEKKNTTNEDVKANNNQPNNNPPKTKEETIKAVGGVSSSKVIDNKKLSMDEAVKAYYDESK